MSFKNILSQNHIVDPFKKAISSDHLSHAYIFTGQKGTGKSLFAKEFTKALFCKSNKGDSCDTCHNCTRIDNNNNPDIHWIALGKKDKFIKIENIRDMQHHVNLSPVESEYKVFIIKEADRMNEESSNCLLKTLEEPTLNTIIILIANSLASVKETIKSRCQIMRFKPIPTDVIKEQLMNEFDTEIKEAEWISRFSCGSLGNAIEFAQDKFYEKNDDIIRRISELKLENNLGFAEIFVESYLSTGDSLEEKRQILKGILNCILQYYRDLLIIKIRDTHSNTDEGDLCLFNVGNEDTLQAQSRIFTQEQITNIIDEILKSFMYIDYNLNINLVIENIFTRIAVMRPPVATYD
jgi:DNA polymerase-3 subunit delta'